MTELAVSLRTSIEAAGTHPAELELGISKSALDELVETGNLIEVDDERKRLRFEVAPGRTIYLTSDGLTSFTIPPADSPLPIKPGAAVSVRCDGHLEGDGNAVLWLIQYGNGERLDHVSAPITQQGCVLELLASDLMQTLRVAVQVSGQGALIVTGITIDPIGTPAELGISVPKALGVSGGRFVPIHKAMDSAWGDQLPDSPPDRMPLDKTGLGSPSQTTSADGRHPMYVFLTVDTEDAYFTEPRLMTGEGVGRDWGVYGVLDTLEARSLSATFFVNVFESSRQPAGRVREVVQDLAERGHEIALHTHPAPELQWYDRPLFRKSKDEQREILLRGRSTLQEWSGQEVASFRAGGYAINDDTLDAAAEAGIRIDSSIYFPSPNNKNRPITVNAPRMVGGLVEVPVTYVIRTSPWGRTVDDRKLDLDWLSPSELLTAIRHLRNEEARTAVFMMHSFSFIRKASRRPDQPRSSAALFTSAVLFNRYVEIYGPNPAVRTAFEEFLDGLVDDPEVEPGPLCARERELRELAAQAPRDVIPVVTRA